MVSVTVRRKISVRVRWAVLLCNRRFGVMRSPGLPYFTPLLPSVVEREYSEGAGESWSVISSVQLATGRTRSVYNRNAHAQYSKHRIRQQAGTALTDGTGRVSLWGAPAPGFRRVAARPDSLTGDLGLHYRV